MSPFVLSDADLAATTELAALRRERTTVADAFAELFGDDLTRALYREATCTSPARPPPDPAP
jgi:Arc/MetJ family transcription regulator